MRPMRCFLKVRLTSQDGLDGWAFSWLRLVRSPILGSILWKAVGCVSSLRTHRPLQRSVTLVPGKSMGPNNRLGDRPSDPFAWLAGRACSALDVSSSIICYLHFDQ